MQNGLEKQIQEAMNRHVMQKIVYLAVDWQDRLYGKRQEGKETKRLACPWSLKMTMLTVQYNCRSP